MTPQEYIQLKAFARQDGALMALLWTAGFACYIGGLANPMLAMAALLLLVLSPFFAASRLRHFRDYGREGIISFSRGYAYTILIFFYGGILLAIAIYLYFAFMDHGYLFGKILDTLNSPEGQEIIKTAGLTAQMDETMKMITELRPIDYALNMLTVIIIMGFVVGVPVAAVMQRQTVRKNT